MKSHPSIPTKFEPAISYHVFDKLDGSNIPAEWHSKCGFHRFASRKRLLSQEHFLAAATSPVHESYEEALDAIFKTQRYEAATCFFEYVGPSSFAGDHFDPPEKMEVVLIDVSPHRKRILAPDVFIELFGHLKVPRSLGKRRLDEAFVESVRNGTLDGLSGEGVVCKAVIRNRLRMTKIKRRDWLERLRAACRDDAEFQRRT